MDPLMNFMSAKSKGNLPDNLSGNFSEAFSKASGQQNMVLQSEKQTQGSSKVQVQNTDKKGLDNGNPQKTDQKQVGTQEDVKAEKVADEAQKAGEELVGKVAEELGVSEEEVLAAMEALGFVMADLLNADNMTELVLTIEGEDMLALMTDEGLYNSLQNLLTMVSEAVDQIGEKVELSPEELEAILEQAKVPEMEENPETVPEDGKRPQIPEGQEDYTVTVERNGETVKVSVEVDGSSQTESTEVTGLKPEAVQEETTADSGKGDGSKKEGSSQKENAQEMTHGNMLLESLLNKGGAVKSEAVFENAMAQNTADTQNIMNQIMDYMRVQVKADMTQMELQLNPASLGTVNINITSKAGVITAQFLTQNETVKAAIESQIVQLKNSFEEQGLKVEAVEVTVASHSFERNLNGDGNGQQQAQDGKKKGNRKVNLNGPAMEEEPAAEEEEPAIMGMEGSTVSFTA
jgi:flagellar hook-length control protein FliK